MCIRDSNEWMRSIPANKQVMILDTCASGAFAEDVVSKRDITADQIRAIDKLQRSSGLHILMGSAADSVSYEASQYGQGLLTYSLLEGMKLGSGVSNDQMVVVDGLFAYAQDRVVGLAKGIGGVQQPRYAAPDGQGFAIGQIDPAVQEQIPLESIKPRVIRPQFSDAKRPKDVLRLEGKLSEWFRSEMDKGRMVFSDVIDAPDSCSVYGKYTQGEELSIDVFVDYNNEELPAATTTLTGTIDNLSPLLQQISDAVVAHCPVQ